MDRLYEIRDSVSGDRLRAYLRSGRNLHAVFKVSLVHEFGVTLQLLDELVGLCHLRIQLVDSALAEEDAPLKHLDALVVVEDQILEAANFHALD